MLALYAALVQPGDLCFDIGANIGDRTALLLALGARVVAAEPQTGCLRRLAQRYASDERVTIVGEALGSRRGEALLQVSTAHTISSISPQWIERVRASGRFAGYRWEKRVKVPMTTLDTLIETHGMPTFCKIDVEGYEAEVLNGLSQPIPSVSFEFTPEFVEAAVDSVNRLSALAPTRFNYSVGESGKLALRNWVGRDEIVERLTHLPDRSIFGDVYARVVR